MTEKRFELRLCSNGLYYLWSNNELSDIYFDKFNKESANEVVNLLNAQHEEIIRLKRVNQELNDELQECMSMLSLKM